MAIRKLVGPPAKITQLLYRSANWPRTSLHAGESEAAGVWRHRALRPPPAATPPQSERTSPPHADRSTYSSSRGRIGRRTNAGAGVAAGGRRGRAAGLSH